MSSKLDKYEQVLRSLGELHFKSQALEADLTRADHDMAHIVDLMLKLSHAHNQISRYLHKAKIAPTLPAVLQQSPLSDAEQQYLQQLAFKALQTSLTGQSWTQTTTDPESLLLRQANTSVSANIPSTQHQEHNTPSLASASHLVTSVAENVSGISEQQKEQLEARITVSDSNCDQANVTSSNGHELVTPAELVTLLQELRTTKSKRTPKRKPGRPKVKRPRGRPPKAKPILDYKAIEQQRLLEHEQLMAERQAAHLAKLMKSTTSSTNDVVVNQQQAVTPDQNPELVTTPVAINETASESSSNSALAVDITTPDKIAISEVITTVPETPTVVATTSTTATEQLSTSQMFFGVEPEIFTANPASAVYDNNQLSAQFQAQINYYQANPDIFDQQHHSYEPDNIQDILVNVTHNYSQQGLLLPTATMTTVTSEEVSSIDTPTPAVMLPPDALINQISEEDMALGLHGFSEEQMNQILFLLTHSYAEIEQLELAATDLELLYTFLEKVDAESNTHS